MKLITSNKGMTLLEILIAMALLAIVVVPLGNFFIDSFVFQSRNQRTVNANKVAEYVLEAFKNGQLLDEFVDGNMHDGLTLQEFYQKLGLTTNKEYDLTITSVKNSNNIEIEQLLEVPEDFEGILTLTSEGLEYEGNLECNINGSTVVINSGYEDNNLKIVNEIDVYSQITIQNLAGQSINVYKDNGITLNVLEGSINQANLTLEEHENTRYDIYTVTVKVVESNDSSVSSTVTTTIRKEI